MLEIAREWTASKQAAAGTSAARGSAVAGRRVEGTMALAPRAPDRLDALRKEAVRS